MRTPVRIGIVGLRGRGVDLARVLHELPQTELRWLCDIDQTAHARLRPRYPEIRFTADVDDLLEDEDLDAVALMIPLEVRCQLARDVLDADKHAFVDSPVAAGAGQAEDLVRLADARGRRLVVSQPLLFGAAIRKLREMIELGELGDLYYLEARRSGRDPDKYGAGVVWGYGADEVAAVINLLGDQPVEVSAHGDDYRGDTVPTVVSARLRFATGISAQLHLSALDPREIRAITAVGSRRTAVVSEGDSARQLVVYSHQDVDDVAGDGRLGAGDVLIPMVARTDPLVAECEAFASAIRAPAAFVGSSREAAAVVAALEALQASLDAAGATTQPRTFPEPARVASADAPGGLVFDLRARSTKAGS